MGGHSYGRWSCVHKNWSGAPGTADGYSWVIVREGDTWKIRKNTASGSGGYCSERENHQDKWMTIEIPQQVVRETSNRNPLQTSPLTRRGTQDQGNHRGNQGKRHHQDTKFQEGPGCDPKALFT
jgi:hypothetical protein